MADNNTAATKLHTLDDEHDYDRQTFTSSTDKDYSQTADNREAFIEKYNANEINEGWRNSELAEYLSYNFDRNSEYRFLFKNARRVAYDTDGQTHEILMTSVDKADTDKAKQATKKLSDNVQNDLRRKLKYEFKDTEDSIFDAGNTTDLMIYSR